MVRLRSGKAIGKINRHLFVRPFQRGGMIALSAKSAATGKNGQVAAKPCGKCRSYGPTAVWEIHPQ
jgi:hypothetical protein